MGADTGTDTHAGRRCAAALAAAAVVCAGLAACTPYVDMPVTDTSRDEVVERSGVPVPDYTSGNRLDFRDEYGRPPARERSAGPARRATSCRLPGGRLGDDAGQRDVLPGVGRGTSQQPLGDDALSLPERDLGGTPAAVGRRVRSAEVTPGGRGARPLVHRVGAAGTDELDVPRRPRCHPRG